MIDQAHFGTVEDRPADWRKALKDGTLKDEPDDDEDRPATPDVIGMLGFDPDEPDEGGEPAEESGLREYGTLGMKWGVRHERPHTVGGRHVLERHPNFQVFKDFLLANGYKEKKGAFRWHQGPAGNVLLQVVGGTWELQRNGQRLARGGTLEGLKAALTAEYAAPPPKPADAVGTMASTPAESHLRSSPIASSKEIGHGVSGAELVTFADGSKAVWKADDKEYKGCRDNVSDGYMGAREYGAWALAKVIGMTDLVTPIAKRTIDGKVGTLSAFQKGVVANAVDRGDRFDGTRDLARAAVFDFITGNEDRHTGNWLMKAGRFRLIDHGLCFPDKGKYVGENERVLGYARGRLNAELEGKDLLRSQADIYTQRKDKILSTLGKAGLPKGSLEGVAARIDQLSKAAELGGWRDLR